MKVAQVIAKTNGLSFIDDNCVALRIEDVSKICDSFFIHDIGVIDWNH